MTRLAVHTLLFTAFLLAACASPPSQGEGTGVRATATPLPTSTTAPIPTATPVPTAVAPSPTPAVPAPAPSEPSPNLSHITTRPKPTIRLGSSNTSVAGLISLPELGAGTYLGFQGGLYPGGSNEPPPEWEAAGLAAAAEVVPRDANGDPNPDGKIVLLSIGMSNASHEWSGRSAYFADVAEGFMEQAAAYPDRNPQVVIVNGAVPGRAANSIVPGGVFYDTYWPMVMERLSQAGVSAAQVQVVWLKNTNPCPGQTICAGGNLTPARGDWPGYAQELQHDLEQIVEELEARFPNLKQIFVSPRTYGGYALAPLNPEPFAFETGFAFKWLIEERIKAGRTSPWLDWGPYLWANGLTPNPQGLTWTYDDFVEEDRTHPSPSGVAKVGGALLDFFTSSPYTRSWFVARP
ncbi:MAG TPA: SGNH/GDSL hydrolase family protein [Anaerolineales bacterium]|nr:SGNH/GDSL hydrolase family protein [Anaerolineales bacterium]